MSARYAATALGAALLLAVIGTLLFGTLHAIVIVPIWDRLPQGFPLAALAAGTVTASYLLFRRSGRIRAGIWPALGFALLLWLSVLPTTLMAALLRRAHLHDQNGSREVVAALVSAALVGLLAGRLARLGSWWLLLAALVPVGLVTAMAGPLPVTNGPRPMLLLLGFLPIFSTATALLSLADRWLLPTPGTSAVADSRAS